MGFSYVYKPLSPSLDEEKSFENKPLDLRTKVSTLEDIKKVEFPYIGMIFYVEDEKELYIITKLGPQYKRGNPLTGTENTRIYYNPETGGDLGCQKLTEFLGIGSGGGISTDLTELVLTGNAEEDFNKIAETLGENSGGFYKVKKNDSEYYYASVAKDKDVNSIPDTHTEAYAISYWEGTYLSHTTSYLKKKTGEETYTYSIQNYNLGDINFTLSTIIDKLDDILNRLGTQEILQEQDEWTEFI